jgi:16S rRNA C967 or C1407 C5-methylase (RsmB/RsmF family)
MKENFRSFHLLEVLKNFEKQALPLDIFLRFYFKEHRALGSHDRRHISEILYRWIRWKSLVDVISGPDSSLEKKIEITEQINPLLLLKNSSIPLEHRLSFPKAYLDLLIEQWGEEKTIQFCLSSNTSAPTTIRTNLQKITREALFTKLSKSHDVSLTPFSPLGIQFSRRVNFLTLDEFKEGLFEVQDEASQLASLQVKAQPKEHFLDYCAGSGGKSLAIAPQMHNKGQIYLHDIRPKALAEAKKRLQRAGIQNAQIVLPEELHKKNLYGKMDWVLVDAPCSGSGTLRRNPDMKWRFSKENLISTIALQKEIFSKALEFVKTGGHIVYTTCSVFFQENEEQVKYFIENFPVIAKNNPFSSLPSENGMDGFYSIVLQKT